MTEIAMETSDFDRLVTEDGLSIGMIYGSGTVLFIKTGQGGTIYGDELKYLHLGEWVRDTYGFSVVVSATELDCREVFLRDMDWVRRLLPASEGDIYYLGVSKGGLIGCWYGAEEPRIRRVLTVNAPLGINFHNRTAPALEKLTAEGLSPCPSANRLTMVYGTRDPSYRYLPFLRERLERLDRFGLKIVEGADHNLQGSTVSLTEMVEKWLLFDAT
jgi:hypothetical protein